MTVCGTGAGRCGRGFTIVEFMVALLLGTLLIGGAISVYLASSRNFQETERSIELLDSGRFALQVLESALRHAGFFAGAPVGNIDNEAGSVGGACSGAGAPYDTTTYLFATAAGGGNALGCIGDARDDTDVLVVKSLVPSPLRDIDPNNPAAVPNGVIDFPTTLNAQTTYVVANEELGVLVDGAAAPAPLVGDGQRVPRGLAWPYNFQIFYVRELAADSFALARKTLTFDTGTGAMAVATENIVNGVEDMRIRFRYDSDDDGEIDSAGYEDDLAAGNWRQVGSVEVFLLVRSRDDDPAYTDAKTYVLGDRAPVQATNDGFWRMQLSQHITLRNPNLVIHGGGT